MSKRPLPPNVIEISAVCDEMRVLMVDELGPGYGIRLMQIPLPLDWPKTRDWSDIPDGAFRCAARPACWMRFERPPDRTLTLGFYRDADLSKLRIRLLVDGVQYELNGAAPEKMQPVRELPGPAGLLTALPASPAPDQSPASAAATAPDAAEPPARQP